MKFNATGFLDIVKEFEKKSLMLTRESGNSNRLYLRGNNLGKKKNAFV